MKNMCVDSDCYYSVGLEIDDFSIGRDAVVNTPRRVHSLWEAALCYLAKVNEPG